MDLRDFIVTPFIIIAVYALAYYIRPRLCNEHNFRYFFPALTIRIIGALALGLLYQFYYQGGDTYNYHTLGSRVIWETFSKDPYTSLQMILSPPDYSQVIKFASRVEFYGDSSSMVVVRIAALFDLITFSAYSGTAVLFAFISFLGSWFLFLSFYEMFPHLAKRIAICTLFVPSVIFWGSGILKDTIVLASLGLATYTLKVIFIDRRFSIKAFFGLMISVFFIFAVKKYVLMSFVPAALIWIYASNLGLIRSMMMRVVLVPLLAVITVVSVYYVVNKVVEDDPKYALNKIAATARTTAYDIRFWSGRNAGSGYSLGELDGSFASMVRLMPAAINVSLFRPYPWEVRNPLMLLSSIEAFVILILSLLLVIRSPFVLMRSLIDPHVIFCLAFSISFAFAVGVATYNFGTLNRYKIPLVPFYLLALVIIADRANKARKVEVLEETEYLSSTV